MFDDIPETIKAKLQQGSTLAAHLKHPEVDPDVHSLSVRFQIAGRAATKTKVYLNTRLWVYLRKAALGRPGRPIHADILSSCQRLHAVGKIACPLSGDIYTEWLSLNPESRHAAAHLMDSISSGLMLQPYRIRVLHEVSYFAWTALLDERVSSPSRYAWLPPAYPLGEMVPSRTPFDSNTERAIAKAMFDNMAKLNFSDLSSLLGDAPARRDDDAIFLDKLNANARRYTGQFRTLDQAFANELNGVLDLWVADLHAFGQRLWSAKRLIRCDGIPTSTEENLWNLLAFVAAGCKAQKMPTRLLSIAIPPALHAVVRFRKSQKFKPGDMLDFMHAAGALVYCDAFFTERSLAAILNGQEFRQLIPHTCSVMADEEQMLTYLRKIETS